MSITVIVSASKYEILQLVKTEEQKRLKTTVFYLEIIT